MDVRDNTADSPCSCQVARVPVRHTEIMVMLLQGQDLLDVGISTATLTRAVTHCWTLHEHSSPELDLECGEIRQ